MNSMSTTRRVMEKPSQEQVQLQQQPFECPRCGSTNTKFCYYNNYSFSQPRHICKACKRYWTRGGTLRNVRVGGGCRKIGKRVKRPSNPSSSSTTTNSNINPSTFTDKSCTDSQSSNLSSACGADGSHLISPMLYGLPANLVPPPHETISNGFLFSGYNNHQHQLGELGLRFSNSIQSIQGIISTSSNPSSDHSTFNGSNTSSATYPTISSLLASTLQHQQKLNLETLLPYDLDIHMKGQGSHGRGCRVLVKDDHEQLGDFESVYHQGQHGQIETGHGTNDHHLQPTEPYILWNCNGSLSGDWLDPDYSSIGSSSVPSLI